MDEEKSLMEQAINSAKEKAQRKAIEEAKRAVKSMLRKGAVSIISTCGPVLIVIMVSIAILAAILVSTNGSGLLGISEEEWDIFVSYLHEIEEQPTKDEGGYYYIVKNGIVGYGINVTKYCDEIQKIGFSTLEDSLIPVEVVDELETQMLEEKYATIEELALSENIELTAYQIFSLIARTIDEEQIDITIIEFIDKYKEYYYNEDNNFYYKDYEKADFQNELFTMWYNDSAEAESDEETEGLEENAELLNLRKSEWCLFQTGYFGYGLKNGVQPRGTDAYCEVELDEDLGGNISLSIEETDSLLDVAQKIHDAQRSWSYSIGSDLKFNNIEASINNPNKVTCCATYVSSVIYKAGFVTESEINSIGYNSSTALFNFLKNKGYAVITSYSQLQPGDIIFMDTKDTMTYEISHVQIYAGNNRWYNAGGNKSIKGNAPYIDTGVGSQFVKAIRLHKEEIKTQTPMNGKNGQDTIM